MAASYSPEWLSETAVSNVLKSGTAIPNIYISDTLEKRQWPCLIVTCNSSSEHKIGRRSEASGGYLSGVFEQIVEVALEIKPDVFIRATENAQIPIEASQLWMQVYQAFHQDVLLQTMLTNAVVQPYECFKAYLEDGSHSVNEDTRVWRKSLMLNLWVMASTG